MRLTVLLTCLLLQVTGLRGEETSESGPVNSSSTSPSPPTTPLVQTDNVGQKTEEKCTLSHKQCLRKKLKENYDPLVHPVLDPNENVTVQIGLALLHYDVDEMRSVLTVDAWMRLSWVDQHLTWDPQEFGGIKSIHFGVDELWKPDILLYNSADHTSFDPYGKTHFLVDNTGKVLWVPPAHLEAFCKLNLRMWPLDTQTCNLKFGSWTSHGEQIDLQLYRDVAEAETLDFYTDNREWNLEQAPLATKKNVKIPML